MGQDHKSAADGLPEKDGSMSDTYTQLYNDEGNGGSEIEDPHYTTLSGTSSTRQYDTSLEKEGINFDQSILLETATWGEQVMDAWFRDYQHFASRLM